MKMRVSRIERMLEKVETTLVPPPRKRLSAIVHEGDDEAVVKEKKEKALAENDPDTKAGSPEKYPPAP
jgi:hypothetical protein